MISPTDTAYRLLPTSPSARELMDAYTPGFFELKFAEERTRQAAPRVGLLVLLKTFQQLGYFVKAFSPSPQTSKSARWISPDLAAVPMT